MENKQLTINIRQCKTDIEHWKTYFGEWKTGI